MSFWESLTVGEEVVLSGDSAVIDTGVVSDVTDGMVTIGFYHHAAMTFLDGDVRMYLPGGASASGSEVRDRGTYSLISLSAYDGGSGNWSATVSRRPATV